MASKRPAAMFLVAALVSGSLTALAAPASAAAAEESRFVSLHNGARSSRGIAKMSVKSDLVTVARRHSARMASKGTIWHNPNLAKEVGGNWTMLGENVGMGPDVNDLFDAFMNSSGHRRNILDRAFNQFGVGVVISEGTIFVTVVFARRSVSASTPTVKKKAPTYKRTTTARPARRPAAAVAKPEAPKPKPVPVVAPRTVSLLVRLVGMDAANVDPVSGKAAGL